MVVKALKVDFNTLRIMRFSTSVVPLDFRTNMHKPRLFRWLDTGRSFECALAGNLLIMYFGSAII